MPTRVGNRNSVPYISGAFGLPGTVLSSLIYWLTTPVEDAEYPNKIGDQDRAAAGGEVFPGRALAFDVDQCAYVADNGDLDIIEGGGDFVLSGWAKANPDGNYEGLIGKTTGASTSGRYGFIKATDDVVYFLYETSTGLVNIPTSIDGDSDTDWHLFTARIDLSGARVYIYTDGVLENAGGTAYTGTFSTLVDTYEFVIGAINVSGGVGYQSFANTEIRDVRIYHKDVTSAADLAALQKGEQLGDEVAWWFCEGTDLLEVFDSAGNNSTDGYTLTAVNFDSTSFVEGNWQSLMNKYGYNIDVNGVEQVPDPNFDNPGLWTIGGGWAVSGGQAVATATTNLLYDPAGLVSGRKYYTVTVVDEYTAGTFRLILGGTTAGVEKGSLGTLIEIIEIPGATDGTLYIDGRAAFTAKLGSVSVKPFYDTAIPPNMRTAVDGVPIEDVLHNPITFAGQAKYPAVARDRSVFMGDGVAYWGMDSTAAFTTGMKLEWRCAVSDEASVQGIISTNDSFKFIRFGKVGGDSLTKLYCETDTNGDVLEFDISLIENVYYTFRIENIGGTTWNLYIDNILIDTSTSTNNTLTINKIAVAGTSLYFFGNVSWVKLNNADGSELFNYQFCEGQGNTVYDVSGNGNHLTGVNVDNNNWGVIDTPTGDYLAEYGVTVVEYSGTTRLVPFLSTKVSQYSSVAPVINAGETYTDYRQGGRHLIPHTYLSMPEDVYELYAADQEERFEIDYDSDFSSDVDGWSIDYGTGAGTMVAANNQLEISVSSWDPSATRPFIRKDDVLTIGESYKVIIQGTGIVTGIYIGSYIDTVDQDLNSDDFVYEFIATGAYFNVYLGDDTYDDFEISKIALYQKTTQTGNNLIDNGGARNAIGALTTTDWDKTTGLMDILAFEDYASEIDGATRVRPFSDVLNTVTCWNSTNPSFDYSTFSNATATGFDAINDGVNTALCGTGGSISFVSGKKYIVSFDMVLNSGAVPIYDLYNSMLGTVVSSDGSQTAVEGLNTFTFTAAVTSGGILRFRNEISVPTNYEIRNLSIRQTGIGDTTNILDQIPQGDELILSGDCANDTYTTFGSATPTGFNATSNGGGTHFAGTADEVVIVEGKYYLISFDLVLNGGLTAPKVRLSTNIVSGGAGVSDENDAINGSNKFVVRSTRTTTGVVTFKNISTTADFEVTNISVKELLVLGDDLVTNGSFTLGADLNTSNCENDSYDSFSGAAPGAYNAAHTTSGTQIAGTADEISIISGQKYIVAFDMVLNSGEAPGYNLWEALSSGGGVTDGGNITASSGSNVHEFTATASVTGVLRFRNTINANYEITNLSVKDADTDWNYGDGCIAYNGTANWDGSQAGTTFTSQVGVYSVDDIVLLKYTVLNYSEGVIRPIFGSTGTTTIDISENGTYSVIGIVSGSTQLFFRAGSTFEGSIDNVSVHKLTWGRQITDDSTNYAGFQYALPIDEFDFAIPVDYVAESIVAQQFHDGLADGISIYNDTGKGFGAFVTGNGFSGKAQRIQSTVDGLIWIQFDTGNLIVGQDYIFSCKYRNNNSRTYFRFAVGSSVPPTMDTNTGDAILYTSGIYTVNSGVPVGLILSGMLAGDWFEVDEIEARAVIDSEFYEPEVLGGDPVIVNTNYLAENPSRYLVRYFNAVDWRDLMLLKADHDLTYEDHSRIMKFTKNS